MLSGLDRELQALLREAIFSYCGPRTNRNIEITSACGNTKHHNPCIDFSARSKAHSRELDSI
jgi:hypothetical protein